MVKLTGPAISTGAAGKLADAVMFVKGKRGTYMKKLTPPQQPRTAAQVGIRAMTKFLNAQWSLLSAAQKQTWENRALQMKAPLYNAYLSGNMKLWNNFLAPQKEDNALRNNLGGSISGSYVLPKIASVLCAIRSSGPPVDWGYIVCRSKTTGFTPSRNTTIAVIQKAIPQFNYYLDTPLDPGTYYYRYAGFFHQGWTTAFSAEFSATVV